MVRLSKLVIYHGRLHQNITKKTNSRSKKTSNELSPNKNHPNGPRISPVGKPLPFMKNTSPTETCCIFDWSRMMHSLLPREVGEISWLMPGKTVHNGKDAMGFSDNIRTFNLVRGKTFPLQKKHTRFPNKYPFWSLNDLAKMECCCSILMAAAYSYWPTS